jgi:hypothetical protein
MKKLKNILTITASSYIANFMKKIIMLDKPHLVFFYAVMNHARVLPTVCPGHHPLAPNNLLS